MPVFTNIAAYKFASLGELPALRAELRRLCRAAGMRGTILLSPEGINLVVAAERAACAHLLVRLRTIPGLADLGAKTSESDHQPFNRMLVKIKREIIAFGVTGIDPASHPAPRIAPRQLKQWLDEGRSLTLLDTRNAYEVKLGTFRGARTLELDHFREFPAAAAALPGHLKDEPVVTFCTGGIRCEKAAPLLEMAGYTNVFQLDGGILNYFAECGGAHYEGDCFVFDRRVALDPTLRETGAALCFACQTPLTITEQEDQRYVESVSCPHCPA
ncbi:MAG: sulfurtransferase [Chthoniobacterales bacterium]|nr:sulfurtransferase [Chthoniobacterales bacterium]